MGFTAFEELMVALVALSTICLIVGYWGHIDKVSERDHKFRMEQLKRQPLKSDSE